MLDPIIIGVIIYASMLIILWIGSSLTYMLEGFPDFHTSLASWGPCSHTPWSAYMASTLPLTSILGRVLDVIIHLLIIRPLQEAGSSG